MADESRSDAAIRHFQARSQQPKTLAQGSGANPYVAVIPIQVRVQYDHPGYAHDYYPHSMADQIDASRFVRVGTSAPLGDSTGARYQCHTAMSSAFDPYNSI
jgi:hypothetical protein